jgi:hypothetical protein
MLYHLRLNAKTRKKSFSLVSLRNLSKLALSNTQRRVPPMMNSLPEDILQNPILSSRFPVNTKYAVARVDDVDTEVMLLDFADKILITVSQGGRLAQWVSLSQPATRFYFRSNGGTRFKYLSRSCPSKMRLITM